MTIPILVNLYQTQVYKTAYRKAYSDLSNAWHQAMANDEIVAREAHYDVTNDTANFNALKNHFSVIKDCSGNITNDWPTTESGSFWGAPISTTACFMDKSGRVWTLWQEGGSHSYMAVFVDTNGPKDPNQYGKDRFFFYGKGSDGVSGSTAGFITDFSVASDVTSTSYTNQAYSCPHLPCYYKSWITGAQ